MVASRTKKLIVCIDTVRDGDKTVPLRAVRLLHPDSLKPLGEAPLGAWEKEKDAVHAALEDFYGSGGFRADT